MKNRWFKSSKDWSLVWRAFSYVKPHLFLFIATFISIIVGISIELIHPMLYGAVIDSIIDKNLNQVYQMLIWILLLTLANGGISLLETYLTDLLGNKIILDIKQDLYDRILSLPVKKFDELQVGEFISRLEGDVGALSNIITFQSMRMILDIAKVIGIGFIIFRMNATLSWIILCVFPIVTLVMYLFGKVLRKKNEEMRNLNDKYYSFLAESFSGIREIKSLHVEKFIQSRFLEKVKEIFRLKIRTDVIDSLSGLASMVLNSISSIIVMGVGGYLIISGSLTMGNYVAFNNYAGQFRGVLGRIAQLNVTIQRGLVSLERIFDLIDHFMIPEEEEEGLVPQVITGQIQCQGISFSYESDQPVLKDINFTARSGKLTALVGTSGSGKTTLFNLLLRFYTPDAGGLYLDHYRIQQLDVSYLRQQIAIVNQDPFLFNLSIRENLLLAKPTAPQDTVEEAARKAYIHDFIMSLPDGYETVIGERGTKLSGGQRQRLAIARAIIKGAKIILLDEATSALDGEAESYIQESLTSLLPDHTVILIAHRLSTVINADQIVVLSEGNVVGTGTHKELMSANSVYQRLYKSSLQQIVS